MHGKPRDMTWTELETTADVNWTSITIKDIPEDRTFDWAIGEEIVIASTDFEGDHAEKRKITDITGTDLNPILHFTEPLLYKHYAGI